MELTNEDVDDILALLDSLPYDEFDLRTAHFRLTLRRTPDGWVQSRQVYPADTDRTNPDMSDSLAIAVATHAGVAARAASVAEADASVAARAASVAEADAWVAARAASVAEADAAVARAEEDAGVVAVRAPLPGTFYRAPRPGEPPFVEVGSQVSEDTVVGIVETMKLMNPVHAGTRGQVEAIPARNAEVVASGSVLVRVRAARG
jgi:acetyl-CoA carboxylase biotin carboxyl carrier protein